MKKSHILFLLVFFTLLLSGGIDVYCQTFQWAKQLGGADNASGRSIAVDASGNVYTTGSFEGTVDFDPGPGVFNLVAAGNDDIFISKLDASGNFVWVKSFGGTDSEDGMSIAVDDSGNVFTTGVFLDTVDFDPGPGIFNLGAVIGSADIFISKLDSSGNFIWAKSMGGINIDESLDIALDGLGNIYTTGVFQFTVDFDPGPGVFNLVAIGYGLNIFISKLDASGNFVWAKKITNLTPYLNTFSYSIAVDGSGNVYTTGVFIDSSDFDPGPGVYFLTSQFDSINWGYFGAAFISKLDSAGNFVWAKNFGGAGNVEGMSIAADTSGNTYVSGYFSGIIDFDPGIDTFNINVAAFSIFVCKLNPSGDLVWVKNMGDAGWDQGFSNTIDLAGNVYTTGGFSDTVDFDPGPGIFNLVAAGNTIGSDIFISKLDSSGNFLWAGNMGGIYQDVGSSIAVDPTGNIYTTGYFRGTADFDPGAGVYNLISAGPANAFVHKMGSPVSINEYGLSKSIRIYPNPFTSEISIAIQKQSLKQVTYVIKNILGQTVYSQIENNFNSTYTKTIDLSFLSNGIYLLDVNIDGERTVKKIVKE